eukprot:1150426-Pelagomonas_calceolata.AAC.2
MHVRPQSIMKVGEVFKLWGSFLKGKPGGVIKKKKLPSRLTQGKIVSAGVITLNGLEKGTHWLRRATSPLHH